jgi:DNA-3-methyladenine glycosylase
VTHRADGAASVQLADRAWFNRSAIEVAPDLLGKVLVHDAPEGRIAGRIVEVEAYLGPEDLAAHSARGRTPRNAVMFGPPGHLYVYFIYGMHHCMNVVCGPDTKPEAVLIRALAITEGEDLARARRGESVSRARLAAGPGNAARALGVDRSLNGTDLLTGPLRLEGGPMPERIETRPRIGVAYSGKWAARPLRFVVPGDPHLSRR